MGTERGVVMKGFVQDIEGLAIKNEEFRQVLYTAKDCQLVVMALKPKEEIGAEAHGRFRVAEETNSGGLCIDRKCLYRPPKDLYRLPKKQKASPKTSLSAFREV